jgi:hypothetical protein
MTATIPAKSSKMDGSSIRTAARIA